MERFTAMLTGFTVFMLPIVGCMPTADLKPAPAANKMAHLTEAAVGRTGGIRMIAQVTEWPGPQSIQRKVTPVRVVIDNQSKIPLRLRYNDFALLTEDGIRHAALPLYQVKGTVLEPVLVSGHSPIANPGFVSDRFTVAPLYNSIYPTMTAYTGTFAYDPFYYDTYGALWKTPPLPTKKMLERALPEGVLDPGGHVEGYLYFEYVPEGSSRVTFRADLGDAQRNHFFGEIRIPFIVQ